MLLIKSVSEEETTTSHSYAPACEPDLVFINGMYLHRGYAYSTADEICLGIIRSNDTNIFPSNSIVNQLLCDLCNEQNEEQIQFIRAQVSHQEREFKGLTRAIYRILHKSRTSATM